MSIPSAHPRRASYENIEVACPVCHEDLVLNRVTDLGTLEPIAGLDVECTNAACLQPFRLIGDTINAPHEMLLLDCTALLERKQYMSVILSAAQAVEMLYARYLHVSLVERLLDTQGLVNYEEVNALSSALAEKTWRYPASLMKRSFFQCVVQHPGPSDSPGAAASLAALPGNDLPTDAVILAAHDQHVGPLLVRLKACTIDNIRNTVVHKQGYRPTKQEAHDALEEVESIVQPLSWKLMLGSPWVLGFHRSR